MGKKKQNSQKTAYWEEWRGEIGRNDNRRYVEMMKERQNLQKISY